MAIVDNPKLKWSTVLKDVVSKYNNTIHTVTGFTPNQLLIGTDLPQQLDITTARQTATFKSNKYKENCKQNYDIKHPSLTLKIGDLVKRRIPINLPTNNKLTPKYEGPFKVTKIHNNLNLEILNIDKNYFLNVHISQIEPFYTRVSN